MAGKGDGIGGVGGPLGLADGSGDHDRGDGAPGSQGSSRLYPCPDCDKVFRHPRSYYQHQHVHRGTHSCPGCRKLFSRRWDLLRHLNKNKYGCPARWREGGRHPPYHNSLSLSALARAAAVAATSHDAAGTPSDPTDHLLAAPWTIATVAPRPGGGSGSSSGGGTSGGSREPRPPEPSASRTSP